MWAMSVLGNAKSDSHRKTHQVEPGGTGRKYMFLPGETLSARARKESAEAVVALMPVQVRVEQRAEGSRKDHSPSSDRSDEKAAETSSSSNCGFACEALRRAGAGGVLCGREAGLPSRDGLRTRMAEEVQ